MRVGLTGGIASGKSAVAAAFAARGVPVIDSDALAREVVAPGSPALNKILLRFGPAVLAADGSLDRRALRKIVFADPLARHDLEAITHPRIRELRDRQSAAAGGPYQIFMIPLLAESTNPPTVERTLVVNCPESMQIERLMRRDQIDEAAARMMLAAQASRERRLSLADDIIDNSGAPAALEAQVDALHRKYLQLAVYGDKAPTAE
jgi:dephospho-CoA kinase